MARCCSRQWMWRGKVRDIVQSTVAKEEAACYTPAGPGGFLNSVFRREAQLRSQSHCLSRRASTVTAQLRIPIAPTHHLPPSSLLALKRSTRAEQRPSPAQPRCFLLSHTQPGFGTKYLSPLSSSTALDMSPFHRGSRAIALWYRHNLSLESAEASSLCSHAKESGRSRPC